MNKLADLENIIKIKFKNKQILKQSLVHKSYDKNNNNEKFEFLGDRILGFIISKELLKIYPMDTEGSLDKKYAYLVNKSSCFKIGNYLNIKNFMFLGENYKSQKKSDDKIVGDCLEALIGAIFIDSGIKEAEKFILRHWRSIIDNFEIPPIDPKSKLQEYTLKKYKQLPKYTLFKKIGPHHNPIFKVEVEIPKIKSSIASGSSKKIAQQKAAQKLINLLKI
tara:strand:- start:2672 stop:3334 length:663 start_codon:yes stop_codon:yes gene_type:complete